jgi:hypothetical protein
MLDNKLHETITALSIVNNPGAACVRAVSHIRGDAFLLPIRCRAHALSLSLSVADSNEQVRAGGARRRCTSLTNGL